jgi:hypothetical protein
MSDPLQGYLKLTLAERKLQAIDRRVCRVPTGKIAACLSE